MSELEPVGIDPANFAKNAATCFFREQIAGLVDPDTRICQLDQAAGALDLIDQSYLVRAERGFSIPVGGEEDEEHVELSDYSKLRFKGIFIGYSKLLMDKFAVIEGDEKYNADHSDILDQAGVLKVAALCLTFDNALIMPGKHPFPNRNMLVVPVLKVNKMA